MRRADVPPESLRILVEAHRRFRSFLERRVGNAADADEILQAAYVKGVERAQFMKNLSMTGAALMLYWLVQTHGYGPFVLGQPL